LLAPALVFFLLGMGATSAEPVIDSLLKGKYLDCHCHTAGIGAGSGCFISRKFRKSFKYPIYLKAFGVTEKELRDSGDALIMDRISRKISQSEHVGAAVILALDGVVDSQGRLDTARSQLYVPNDFVARETRRHPNLLFGASINPLRKDALAELTLAKVQGAVLVKWLPSIMEFDPADSALIPFYRALKELDLPLLTHTGTENSFLHAKDEFCDPMRLELPLKLGVTVIAAHVGTPGETGGEKNMERALRLLGRYPNFYADISSLTQVNKLASLARILPRPEAKGKLIFGTDFPLTETLLVSPYFQACKLSFKRLRAIAKLENSWDRDVELKKALGVPEEVFTLSAELLLGKAK
jgi:predicted TIM-barrel fold metal-dependent hydrolase